MDLKALKYEQQQAYMLRSNYHYTFDECARFFYPRAVGFSGKYQPGQKVMENVRDSAGTLALNRFVAILMQGMTPRNTFWHGFEIPEDPEMMDYQPVRDWVEKLTARIFSHRYAAGSGFDTTMKLTYRSEGCFGTAVFYRESRRDPADLLFKYVPVDLRECFPLTDMRGNIVAMHRVYERTAMQIVDDWPAAQNNATIAQALRTKETKKFKIQHSVYPRRDRDSRYRDAMNKRFASVYFLVDEEFQLSVGGYDSFPYVLARLDPDGVEPWGIGIGEHALPDMKELNTFVATTTRTALKQVDPPLLAHEDYEYKPNLNPAAINIGGLDDQGRERLKTMTHGGNAILGLEMQNQRRTAIDETFWNSVFQLLKQYPNMTATEVRERVRRSNALVAPAIGQQETDIFAPLISWEVETLLDAGEMPPPPPELLDRRIVPSYSSPLLKVIRADEADNIETALGFVLAMVEAGFEDARDVVNETEAVRAVLDGKGVPAKVMRSRAEAKQRGRARAEAAAQRNQIDQAQQMAQAAGAVSPALAALNNMQGANQ